MQQRTRSMLREGLVAGFIGATSVAIWFLILDTIAGEPLVTPLVLGRALVSILGPSPEGGPHLLDQPTVQIVLYTIFHYAAFFVVGTLVALLLRLARREPSVLLGFIILFVVFEIGFHGFVALLAETTVLGNLVWYQVMIGNLIAAALMGYYLWRAHPELSEQLTHALD